MSAHTPGPWSLFPTEVGWIVNQKGGPGYVGTLSKVSHRAAQCEANARLIASAPELLEALQAIASIDLANVNQYARGWVEHAQVIARAAIQKATAGENE
jgi:hypothetical protein